MGAIWLRDLPDVIDAAGLEVSTYEGWETRSRSSGGYDEVWAVFCHHTASNTSAESDTHYMWAADSSNDDTPVGALYLGRDGAVIVGAAGATNCQGKGGPWPSSHGSIPLDKGNCYGIAIEAANNGTGEPWPIAQQEAYVTLVAALCDHYGLDMARDVVAHCEWAPTRKIDPAGESKWATGSSSWDMDSFRTDCLNCNIDDEEDDMALSDEDIERIAAATAKKVWQTQIDVGGHPDANIASVVGWIYSNTETIENQTKP